MPLNGTLAIAPGLDLPQLTDPGREPFALGPVDVLTVSFEHNYDAATTHLPPALHPTVPPTASWMFYVVPDGELGPFTLAQLRAGCRAGYRARSFLLGSWVDNEVAGEQLRARWGYQCRPAEVSVRAWFERVEGEVRCDGRVVGGCALLDPTPVAPSDATFTSNLHLVDVPGRGPRVVQVDPELDFQRADYGTPRSTAFDADALGVPGMVPRLPISATWVRAEVRLPALRFAFDPLLPPQRGSERLDQAS